MTRQTFYPNPNIPKGFSPATRVGNIVFVSGQVSVNADGDVVGEGDAGEQSRQCFKNVEAALNAAGASWDDVTKITAFMIDVNDYSEYAAARLEIFPDNGPASSTVVIKELVNPKYLIEIEAIAVIE